jgi:hypothetical protein
MTQNALQVQVPRLVEQSGDDPNVNKLPQVLNLLGVTSMTSITNDPHYWEQYEQMNCWYCGCRLYHRRNLYERILVTPTGEEERKQCRVAPPGWKVLAYDHALPRSRGGTNAEWNLVQACESCNCSKNNKTVEEYRQYKAKKLRTPTHFFWIEREIGEIIADILTKNQIEELEEEINNDKRLMKDYQARAKQKEAKVAALERKIQTLKASLGKNGVVPSCL